MDKHQKVMELIEEIENSKEDSGRTYKAITFNKPKKPLLINTETGVATDAIAQTNIITEHFRNMFPKEDIESLPYIQPLKMDLPTQIEEVEKAVKAL